MSAPEEPQYVYCDRPIFIIGTERSGSNLLRVILDGHPNIAIPHPPHILKYFTPLLGRFGDLSHAEQFRRLATDVHRLVRWHIHPWPQVPTVEALIRDARTKDLLGLYEALYAWYAQSVGKRRWGCKSTFVIHEAQAIFDRFPNARFVWLVRDPRDVAASSRETVFNPTGSRATAELWRDQQRLGLELENTLPSRSLLRCHYESLVRTPVAELARIGDFIGEQLEPDLLRFAERPAAHIATALSTAWSGLSRPVFDDSVGAFSSRLPCAEVVEVENATSAEMLALGYRLAGDGTHVEANRRPLLIERARREIRSVMKDRNWWRRWRRGLFLWYLGARARSWA